MAPIGVFRAVRGDLYNIGPNQAEWTSAQFGPFGFRGKRITTRHQEVTTYGT